MKSFHEYLAEMAQAADDHKGTIYWDDQDQDWVQQAMSQGVTELSAIRSRYTLLLQDKPGEGPAECRFFPAGGKHLVKKTIERTHLAHLQKKLREAGFPQAAENGLQAFKDEDRTAGTFGDQMAVAMTKTDAGNFKKNGKLIINGKMAADPKLRDFDHFWGQTAGYTNPKEVFTMDENYEDVVKVVSRFKGSTIDPRVWDVFEQNQDEYIKSALSMMGKYFRSQVPDAFDDILQRKEALAQSLAYALARGGMPQNDHPDKIAVESIALFNSLFKNGIQYVLRKWHNTAISKTGNVGSALTSTAKDGSSQAMDVADRNADASNSSTMGKGSGSLLQAASRDDAQGHTTGSKSRKQIQDEKEREAAMAPIVGVLDKMRRQAPLDPEDMAARQKFLDMARAGTLHPSITRDVIDTLKQPPAVGKKKLDGEFDYHSYINEPEPADDVSAYRRGGYARNRFEHAGATFVVGNPKPGPDYQIEGDPAGSAKSMRKSFKKFVQKRDAGR